MKSRQKEPTGALTDRAEESRLVRQQHLNGAVDQIQAAMDLWCRQPTPHGGMGRRGRNLYPGPLWDRLKIAHDYAGIAASDLDWIGNENAEANSVKRAKDARDAIKAALPKVPTPADGHLRIALAGIREALR